MQQEQQDKGEPQQQKKKKRPEKTLAVGGRGLVGVRLRQKWDLGGGRV